MKRLNVQEIEKVNLHPLNRISKEWLERAGVSPDPRTLHALSLITWALGEHAIQVDSTRDPLIAGQTEAALQGMATRWRPEKVMEFIAMSHTGSATITPDELEEAGSPVDAAQMLLGRLTSAIIAKRQGTNFRI